MSKQLPERPNLDHLRKQAKDLLAGFKSADSGALERFKILPLLHGDSDQKKARRLALHDAENFREAICRIFCRVSCQLL